MLDIYYLIELCI